MGVSSKRVQASISSFFKSKRGKSPERTPETFASKEAPIVAAKKARRSEDSGHDVQKKRAMSPSGAVKRRRMTTEAHAPDAGSADDGASEKDPANASEDGSHKDTDKSAQLVAEATDLLGGLKVNSQLGSTHVQLVRRRPGVSYTPLEQQVLEAKETHSDTVLAVEVGYKFRFFGEDARIASQVLGIMCTQANNFYNASIPTPRLAVHVRRLVHAGFRVGVVRQNETAALKAAGPKRSAPFMRSVSQVITAATLVEDVGADDAAPWLMSLAEDHSGAGIGMVAAQVATGCVLVDHFEDGFLRSALATRLAHLRPAELLLPQQLNEQTKSALAAHVGRRIDAGEPREPLLEQVGRVGPRVEFVDSVFSAIDQCERLGAANMAPHVLDLAPAVAEALARMLAYLEPLGRGLARGVLAGGRPFARFHTRTHMLLSATALQTLQVFSEPTASGAHQVKADSLFAAMDRTHSPFGRRLLRQWVAHPLLDHDELKARADAVSFLRDALYTDGGSAGAHVQQQALSAARGKLNQLVDIERGICRLHYGLASPPELLRILRSLRTAASVLPSAIDHAPAAVNEILRQGHQPALRQLIGLWFEQISAKEAQSGSKERMFVQGPLHARMQEHHDRLQAIEDELQASAAGVAAQLDMPDFAFRSISGIDYLIDVRSTRKGVPDDWIRISTTKTNSRYHTPFAAQKLVEREQRREALQLSAANAYSEFLASISEHYVALRQLVVALAAFDALCSLATLASTEGFCRPQMIDSAEAHVQLVDAVHPVLRLHTDYVANTVDLGGASRALLLTGPNAGGKSSLIRTIALVCVMAQCGSFVPARSARLSLVDSIHTRIGAGDNLLRGESTFMVEMRETAEIMRQCTPRSLAILDELGRGTSTHDGAAIAFAVLSHLVAARTLTLFVTHYAHIADCFAADPLVRCCHMAFIERTGQDGISELTFLYRLADGVSTDSFGLNVARIAGLPSALLLCAHRKAAWMRVEMESRWAARHARALQLAVRARMGEGDREE
ncbi:Mismatch repair protein msh3 [Coemansia sp. IMI 203386]|nr:Mismatch repair protein msh3 [Coemansia sp. IMI 203386]